MPPREVSFTAVGDDGRPRTVALEVDPGTARPSPPVTFPPRCHVIPGRPAIVFPARVGDTMRSCVVGFDVLGRLDRSKLAGESGMVAAFERHRPAVEATALVAIRAHSGRLPTEIVVPG